MKCVLFDLDGTVADTEVLKAKALSLAIARLGGSITPQIYKKVMGQSWESVTDTFFRESGVATSLDVFNPHFRELYSKLIEEELEENRSIVPFIRFLKERNISKGLVSSASPWMIETTLAKLDLQNAFDIIISNADIERHKPFPDAYLKALEKLGYSASEAMAFEDSESGFKAANSAGLKVFGVSHFYNEAHDFSLCEKIINNFENCLSWDLFKK